MLERHRYALWIPPEILPDYSLQAIAEECGYANNSNFSRTFKQLEGMTPGQWLSAQKGDL